jgi:hypothetical protein
MDITITIEGDGEADVTVRDASGGAAAEASPDVGVSTVDDGVTTEAELESMLAEAVEPPAQFGETGVPEGPENAVEPPAQFRGRGSARSPGSGPREGYVDVDEYR